MTEEFLLKCLALCKAPIVLDCLYAAATKVDPTEAKSFCNQDYLEALQAAKAKGLVKITYDSKTRVDVIERVP